MVVFGGRFDVQFNQSIKAISRTRSGGCATSWLVALLSKLSHHQYCVGPFDIPFHTGIRESHVLCHMY